MLKLNGTWLFIDFEVSCDTGKRREGGRERGREEGRKKERREGGREKGKEGRREKGES